MIAARAELLYEGDFHASDDDSPWARGERHRLVAGCQAALGADPSAQTQELHLRILRGGTDHLTG